MGDFLTRLDETLARLGLASEPWLLHGRKLRGSLEGRAVTGNLSPRSTRGGGTERRRYLGHRFELVVATPLPARLIVFPPSRLRLFVARTNRWFGLRELRLDGPLAHLCAWTADVEWTSRLLADGPAATSVATLLPADGPASAGLQLSPGRWQLSTLDHGEQVLAALPPSLDALLSLAERADALPGPARPYQPSWIERRQRTALVGGLLGCTAAFVLLGVLVAAALITVSFLAAGGNGP